MENLGTLFIIVIILVAIACSLLGFMTGTFFEYYKSYKKKSKAAERKIKKLQENYDRLVKESEEEFNSIEFINV